MRIFVIEDNRDILANMLDYLQLKGYVADCAEDGLSGLHRAATQTYDLIVLDLMLPNIDGFELCRRLREDGKSAMPIIMLTARNTLEDRLQGFSVSVDDYLAKPFALSELVARIEAVLCRAQGKRRLLEVADLSYDLDMLEVRRAGRLLKLNPIGLKLLAVLMQKSPAVVWREALEESCGGDAPDSDSLRSHSTCCARLSTSPLPARSCIPSMAWVSSWRSGGKPGYEPQESRKPSARPASRPPPRRGILAGAGLCHARSGSRTRLQNDGRKSGLSSSITCRGEKCPIPSAAYVSS
jgi:DNA-binding response OmpR family regulator